MVKGRTADLSDVSDAASAEKMISSVYDDGEATINGRKYVLTKPAHKQRRKVFSFFTANQLLMTRHDYSFLDTAEFEQVETVINSLVMFDGSLLSRLPNHWDEYPEDYVLLITTMLGVISYPFFRGVVGG